MSIVDEVGQDYLNTFVQPIPHFNVKPNGQTWFKSQYGFSFDQFRKEHLEEGTKDYGFIAKWYPQYCVIDLDGVTHTFVEEIRGKLGLNDNNSFVFHTESPDSYHIIFRVNYRGRPETQRLLYSIMQPFARRHGVEVYPQPNKTIRAPFGKKETPVNPDHVFMDWRDYTYWFGKLDEYDLSDVPYQQGILDLDKPASKGKLPAYIVGLDYFKHGLQQPGDRERGQFHVIYYLWRNNVPLDTAIETTYQWLKDNHNGYSKEVNKRNWRQIKKHIQRQASTIYSFYSYPDETHNVHQGFITKDDIPAIFHISEGSLPKARFLFQLLKYYYPRRLRKSAPIHTDLLIEWSSANAYQARIEELRTKGLVQRGGFYVPGARSKDIILNWNYKHPDGAILQDGRAPDNLEDTLALAYNKDELRSLLKNIKMDRGHISRYLKQVYSPPETTQEVFPLDIREDIGDVS